MKRRPLRISRRSAVEGALVIGLMLLAAWVRQNNLLLVPAITDESREVSFALAIVQGARPLVSVDPYNGPLFHYLLAALISFCGPSIALPRLFVLVLGALTVGLTYAVGRILSGRVAGVTAALLLAFSGVHVAINSHIAWSNASTPFFTTLALIPFCTAWRFDRPRDLVWGGLLFGLALQTHPTVLAFGIGVSLALVSSAKARAWLATPWPYAAVALAVLAYGNVLFYNVQYAADPASSMGAVARRAYAFSPVTDIGQYGTRLGAQMLELARMLAPAFTAYADPFRYLAFPYFWGGALAALGLFYTARRNRIPLCIVATTLVLFPVLNRRENFPIESRYLSFLLPLLYVSTGVVTARLATGLTRGKRAGRYPFLRWAAAGLLLGLVGAWCLFAWWSVNSYYNFFLTRGPNNITLLRLVQETRRMGQPVWLDRELFSGYWLGAGAEAGEALAYLYNLDGRPCRVLDAETTLAEAPASSLVVLADSTYDRLKNAAHLKLIDPGPPLIETTPVLGHYALYRLAP